jgi:hypothetical protein
MDEMLRHAVNQCMGNGALTTHPADNKRAVIIIKMANAYPEHREEIIQMVKDARRQWMIIQTEWQRKWQHNRRTVTKRSQIIRWKRWGERHLMSTIIRAEMESINTREKYVRCDGKNNSTRRKMNYERSV